MIIKRKKIIAVSFVLAFLLVVNICTVSAQLNNTLPDPVSPNNTVGSESSGGGGTSNTNNGPGGGSSIQAGPGGPGDEEPPITDAPIDGGIAILLSVALVQGYLISKKNFKIKLPVNS